MLSPMMSDGPVTRRADKQDSRCRRGQWLARTIGPYTPARLTTTNSALSYCWGCKRNLCCLQIAAMMQIGSGHSLTSKVRGPIFRRNAIARTRSALVLTFTARNLVERFFNKIKQCRRVATRYDKLAANYLAFIKLASIRIWLRANESTP